MENSMYKTAAAAFGAVISFFSGMPPLLTALLGVMTLDYVTGLACGAMGVSKKTQSGGISSRAAMKGLLRKAAILLVVALAALVDFAVASGSGVTFSATTGAVCLWFIASEGVSVLENAAEMGVPVPGVLRRALDVLRGEADDAQMDSRT